MNNWKKIQSFFISPFEIIKKINLYESLFKSNEINEGNLNIKWINYLY